MNRIQKIADNSTEYSTWCVTYDAIINGTDAGFWIDSKNIVSIVIGDATKDVIRDAVDKALKNG
jgi:hypothetical protein